MNILIGGALIVVALALVIFPGFRKKLKVLAGGFLNIFVEDLAKTPEGARAVYDQAIEEAQTQYNEADDMYRRQAGALDQLRTKIKSLEGELQTTERKCESLVRAGDTVNARVYSQRRTEIVTELEQKRTYERDLALAVQEVQNIHTLTGERLRKLQAEKKQVIDGMKLDESMKSVLDDLDDLKRSTEVDKMLGTVKDHAADLRKEVQGGMIVHANRASTKISAAERASADAGADEYLASLQAKYGKGQVQASSGGSL